MKVANFSLRNQIKVIWPQNVGNFYTNLNSKWRTGQPCIELFLFLVQKIVILAVWLKNYCHQQRIFPCVSVIMFPPAGDVESVFLVKILCDLIAFSHFQGYQIGNMFIGEIEHV